MGAKLHGYEVDRPVRAGYLGDEKGGMKMERFWGDSNMVIKQKEKHPTREILEKGGVVDGESFELMLREEAEENKMSALEDIEENLIQLNKTVYEIYRLLAQERS